MRAVRLAVAALVLTVLTLAHGGLRRALRAGDAPLDEIPRLVPARGRLVCPRVPLVTYAGSRLAYAAPVRVHPSFRPHLAAFEELVAGAAREVYGREPRRLLHAGGYNCRRVAGWPNVLSEHGLGNALDVVGFEFGPAAKKEGRLARGKAARGKAGLVGAGLAGAFSVRVLRDWGGGRGARGLHARFLHLVLARVRAAPELFRVALGPGDPHHADHFHLDRSPTLARNLWLSLRELLGG